MNYDYLPNHIANPDPTIYLSDNYIVLDAETTGLEKGSALNRDNSLILFVAGKDSKYKSYIGNEKEQESLVKLCESVDFIVMQNVKFDLQWLIRCGIDPTKVVTYDTILGAYVQDGNQPWKPKDLNSLAVRYGLKAQKDNLVNKMIKSGICPSRIPTRWLVEYCAKDVWLTEQVFLRQRKQLQDQGLLPVFYTRNLLTPALADIEFNGMCLDQEVVEKEYYKVVNEKIELDFKLDKLTGGINPRSGNQVSDFLYKTLKFPVPKKNGKPVVNKKGYHPVDKDAIAGLTPRTNRQKEFLCLKEEQGKVDSRLSKSMEFFRGVCEERGGIFHATFSQTTTKTQRLASNGRKIQFALFQKPKSVQFQNLPRIYKPCFRARREGWLIGEIDQAQLEFRVAGEMTQDPQIYYDILNKVDIHSFTASILNGVDFEWIAKGVKEGDPEAKRMRQDAKEHTFKPVYGGEKGTPEQEAYYKAFQEKYHVLYSAQEDWCVQVLGRKKLELPTGIVAYWPDTKMDKNGYINNRHAIFNWPIQHLATAEIVPIGVVYQWHRLKAEGLQSFLVNTVHDSSIGEVHPDEKEIYADIGRRSFIDDTLRYLDIMYGIKFTMPLEAEVEFGKWWSVKEGKDNPLLEAA